MGKPQLRVVRKPRNVCNSRSIPLVLLLLLQQIAISQQERYFTPTRLPTGVSPIRCHPYGLVLQAFPSQLTPRPSCQIPLPILTSTPIASKPASSHLNNPSETSETVLKVHYPSKTMNKTLTGSCQAIGKALAHGVPSQIANSVMKNPTLRNHVIANTLKIVSKEVTALCSKRILHF